MINERRRQQSHNRMRMQRSIAVESGSSFIAVRSASSVGSSLSLRTQRYSTASAALCSEWCQHVTSDESHIAESRIDDVESALCDRRLTSALCSHCSASLGSADAQCPSSLRCTLSSPSLIDEPPAGSGLIGITVACRSASSASPVRAVPIAVVCSCFCSPLCRCGPVRFVVCCCALLSSSIDDQLSLFNAYIFVPFISSRIVFHHTEMVRTHSTQMDQSSDGTQCNREISRPLARDECRPISGESQR